MKKIISLLLVLIMVFSMTAFASAAGNSFTDIYNSKNEDAIEFLYDLGLVEGYSVTKFGPKKNLTRAEACALIVRALIEDDEIYASVRDYFTDVDDYAWYREWVDTAYRNEIMHGYGNGKFGPTDYVTYAQYATILVNALGYDSLAFEGTWPTNVEELAVKLDLYDNVSVHVSDDAITREDAAQMLYNALWCKMVGQRGVTLYDVVTAEKYNTYTTRVKILTYTENGWVEFMEETGNIRWVHISDVYFVNHHGITVGHIEWAEVTCDADYSEVYELVLYACEAPNTDGVATPDLEAGEDKYATKIVYVSDPTAPKAYHNDKDCPLFAENNRTAHEVALTEAQLSTLKPCGTCVTKVDAE